jgi:predicted nucleotidyltransferase component of viral defense system
MLDLNRRGNITQEERFAVAEVMQLFLLNETARAADWRMGDAAFHGGTSLKVAWNSPRFSEDLDFMVAENRLDELYAVGQTIATRVRKGVAAWKPGSVVEFSAKKGEGEDRIDVWKVKWTHPARIGKVMVKMEFFAADAALLSEYAATMQTPRFGATSVVKATMPLPVADMVSMWADKVKATATRPEYKWRDGFDLDFVAAHFARLADEVAMGTSRAGAKPPSEAELLAALTRTAAIYGKTHGDIIDGLERRLDSGVFDDCEGFSRDMSLWLPAELHRRLDEIGDLGRRLESAKREVCLGLELLKEAPRNGVGAGVRP